MASVLSVSRSPAPRTAIQKAGHARARHLRRDIIRALQDAAEDAGVSRRALCLAAGIGPNTAAFVIAEVGDPAAHFRSASALAAYVGAIPGLKQSGKRTSSRAALTPIGNARLRKALWMPTLTAVRYNAWLRSLPG